MTTVTHAVQSTHSPIKNLKQNRYPIVYVSRLGQSFQPIKHNLVSVSIGHELQNSPIQNPIPSSSRRLIS